MLKDAEKLKPSTNGYHKMEVILEMIETSVNIMQTRASLLEERLKQNEGVEVQKVA